MSAKTEVQSPFENGHAVFYCEAINDIDMQNSMFRFPKGTTYEATGDWAERGMGNPIYKVYIPVRRALKVKLAVQSFLRSMCPTGFASLKS